jgi:hypothetical protein
MRSGTQQPNAESSEQSRSRDGSQTTTRGRPVHRIGGSLIPPRSNLSGLLPQPDPEAAVEEAEKDSFQETTQPTDSAAEASMNSGGSGQHAGSTPQLTVGPASQRTIRFRDGAGVRARSPGSLAEQDLQSAQ